MTSPLERERLLHELGLSEYAARAYLALLELGPAQARDISRLAKVPIAKVYSTLEQLALKGFVVSLPEMPRRYAPEPMERVMKRIAGEHDARAKEAEARAEEFGKIFTMARKDHASDRGTITLLRGRRVVNEKLMQLSEASADVVIVASDKLAARLGRALEDPRHRWMSDSRRSPNPVTLAVFDETAALLSHHVPDDARQHEGLDVAVLIQEEAIVRALRDLIEQAWPAPAVAAPEAASAD